MLNVVVRGLGAPGQLLAVPGSKSAHSLIVHLLVKRQPSSVAISDIGRFMLLDQ